MTPDDLLTRKECAAILGVSVEHFARRVQPDLKVLRIGRNVRIRRRVLMRWIEEREAVRGSR